MRYADLHLHTYYSDGTRSPQEVVDLAAKLDLHIISISDHDNLGGYCEIRDYAARQGVTLVPGVELSALHRGVDIHILGYAFDVTDEYVNRRLESFRHVRERRGDVMVDKLRALGLPIRSERVAELAAGGSVGRPHVARALVEAGVVPSIEEAFVQYLGPGKPAYVDKERFSVEEAVTMIRRAGGVTSLAHPTLYRDHLTIVPEVLDGGIDGIEAYHPKVDEQWREHYLTVARERGLFVTGGSDDHGAAKSEETIGTIHVPEELIGSILARV